MWVVQWEILGTCLAVTGADINLCKDLVSRLKM